MHRVFSWFILLLIGSPTELVTQGHPLLGKRVRVVHACAAAAGNNRRCRSEGTVRAIDSDAIRLVLESGDGRIIPAGSVDRLSVAQGTRSNFWAGAGWGLVIGAALGTAIGATQEFCIFQCSNAAPIGLMLGAPTGLVLGGVVGAATRSTRWRPWEGGDVGVRLRAVRGGVGVGIDLAF
jgi:hypothetical protein